MRLIFIISIFTLFLYGDKILIINSNGEVGKYKETVDAFKNSFTKPFKTIDVSKMDTNEIQEYLYDEYPDIVYTVGAKAYQYTNKFIPEKKIFFSSIVNWKRLAIDKKRFGVSNELHSGMQLTLIKSIFNDIKTIGVIYSKYTKDIVDDLRINGKKMGINIIAKKVTKNSIQNESFDNIIHQTEAMIIISDPLFLSDEKVVKNLFTLSKQNKKPIFAYHELFIKYGAVLITSLDNPTIGRQIATMIQSDINKDKIIKIQYPAGTKVIFNKKAVEQMEIKFSNNISFIANKVIE
jgi:putative tryptophan/tyrosine transport system substrate-binding protein